MPADAAPPPSLDLPGHGGDLAAAEARFGTPAQGWLDLSTGINPFAYPLPAMAPEVWRRLPDSGALARLRQAAARRYGTPPERVLAAPGTQALIQALPRLLAPTRVAVLSPTYAEHARRWGSAGHEVLPCSGIEEIADAGVVVAVNPNNPDGRRLDPAVLTGTAAQLARRGGLLVVDEAFADPEPELSVATAAGPGLVVLRSFGKFFGLAGLRLGFALGDPALLAALADRLGPWAVPGPALAVGTAALADEAWIAATRRRLRREAAALDRMLADAGLGLLGGTPLFRLVAAPRAWALYEHLAGRGILVRPFADQPRWLRFGLPPGPAERRRLAVALADWTGRTAGPR